jgi:AcrR family transcriptional regulator
MTSTIPPPPATRKARATYESLIEATREVLRHSGVPSPEAIAAEAGVSPATLYSYLSSKDAMVAAAFDTVLAAMHGDLVEVLSVEGLLERGLEAVVHETVRHVVRGFLQDARLVRLAIARLPESELAREVYRRREEATLAHVERFVRLGQEAAKLRAGDPGVLAQAFVVGIQGLQNPLVLRPGSGPVVDEVACGLVALLAPPD